MGPSKDACMDVIEDHAASSETDLHILEKINLSFSVQLAITNAPNLTRFKVAGDLPELQVNFSDTKYSKLIPICITPERLTLIETLMRFIDVAIPKFGDDTPSEQKSRPAIIHQSLPSFRPHVIEEYVLDDTRSIRTAEDPDESRDDASSQGDKGGDQFYEARDDIAEVSLTAQTHSDRADVLQSQRAALQQINFEFSFSVGKLQASLFKSTSATAEKALADATLEGFGLTFAQRKYDMSVDLFLRNVTLAMASHGGAEKRPLLSSAADSSSTSPSDLKLVRVKYMKVQKDSPEFMGVHEGVDQSVDTELSTFKITLAPEPILSLYDFIMTTFVPKNDDNPDTNEQAAKHHQEQEAAQVSSDKIRVRVKLTSAQGMYPSSHSSSNDLDSHD
jgi:vacuolar protein sorting-associated protein 13A/C